MEKAKVYFIKEITEDNVVKIYESCNRELKGTVAAADLELPRVGETFGMSERESDYGKLVSRMKELDMKAEDYEWYLKLRKYGACPRSGYGIGFERLLMYITGIESVKDVIPYPRADKYCDY